MYRSLIYRGDELTRSLLRPHKLWLVVLLLFISLLCGILLFTAPSVGAAQTVPYKIGFQGRLADSMGNPMPDGSYNMRFRIADALTGGTILWTETRETTNRVQLINGLFSVRLGDVAGLAPTTLYPLYLEVELPTPATATCSTGGCAVWTEGPMEDRTLLGSTPQSFNADTIDGIDGASLAQLSANQTFSGNNTFTGTFLQQNTSSTAFRVQNAGGTNALLIDTSTLAVKIGGGDVTPDASPALLVLDYKNTTGDPTGTEGAMYYNSATDNFRCYEEGLWKNCISSAATRFDMHYEFLRSNAPALGDAAYVLSGGLYTKLTNGTFVRIAGEQDHPGILQFTTNVSATGLASLSTSDDTTHGILFGAGTWINTTVIRIPTASATGQTFNVYTGFMDATTTLNPLNGCFFRYTDSLNNNRWQGVCRNASSESVCDPVNSVPSSAAAVGGATWYTLRVAVNSAATLATFVLEDGSSTYTCPVSSNIPTSNRVSIGMGIRKTLGATLRTADFDLTETIGEGLTR